MLVGGWLPCVCCTWAQVEINELVMNKFNIVLMMASMKSF